jgi:CheY-like chemotaxis protein
MAPSPMVLVVDDDLLVRINIAEILEEAGLAVVEARDAASALDVMREKSEVQLVCTDISMPGELDGVGLAIRLQDEYPHVKVILLSAMAWGRALPPRIPFVAKPFDSRALTKLVWAELGFGAAGSEASSAA